MISLNSTPVCRTLERLCCKLDKSSSGAGTRSTRQLHSPIRKHRWSIELEERKVKSVRAVSAESEIAQSQEDKGDEKFDWFKNWWPVQAVENLPTDRPYRVQLLGKYYVVWKGQSGDWIAMDDECPHRLAPLSEGRIEMDGNLLCSYHAWRFNESGKCVKIPHAEDEKAHSVACSSPRSAVQTYPCKTRGSLLWIWPDKSISAFTDSEKMLLPIDDDIAGSLERAAAEGAFYTYVRHMPYGFDVLIENLCDPAHVPVSHHGVIPEFSRYNAEPLEATFFKGTARGHETATLRYKPWFPVLDYSQFELRKPGFIVVTSMMKDEDVPLSKTILTGYPLCPGRSVIIVSEVSQSRLKQTKKSTLLQSLVEKWQILLFHAVSQSAVSDGDSVFLHEQDKKIRRLGASFSARKEYFAPTSSDLLVMNFRKWFEEEAESGAAYGNTKIQPHEPTLTKEQMLDRYEQHTKHCKGCRETLYRVESLIKILRFLSLAALFIGSLILFRSTNAEAIVWKAVLKTRSLWITTVIGVLAALLRNFMEKNVKPLYYFKDWVHADND